MYIPHFTWCRGKMKVKSTKWIPFLLYVHLVSTWHSSQDGCSQHPPLPYIFFVALLLPWIILNSNRRTKVGTRLVIPNVRCHICTWVQTTVSFRMQRHHKAEHPEQWRVTVGLGKVTMLCCAQPMSWLESVLKGTASLSKSTQSTQGFLYCKGWKAWDPDLHVLPESLVHKQVSYLFVNGVFASAVCLPKTL